MRLKLGCQGRGIKRWKPNADQKDVKVLSCISLKHPPIAGLPGGLKWCQSGVVICSVVSG